MHTAIMGKNNKDNKGKGRKIARRHILSWG